MALNSIPPRDTDGKEPPCDTETKGPPRDRETKKPPHDAEAQESVHSPEVKEHQPDTHPTSRRWWRVWDNYPLLKRVLVWNVIAVLSTGSIVLLTSEPNFADFTLYKAVRHLAAIAFTISCVELFWHTFIAVGQEKKLEADRRQMLAEARKEFQRLNQIKDTSVLAVDTKLALSSRADACENCIFIVKFFLPGADEFFKELKPRVEAGIVKRIELVLLDNRTDTPGARLHEERAATMTDFTRYGDTLQRGIAAEDGAYYRLETRKTIKALCNFAHSVRDVHLETFKLYLCNQLPTISITQLSKEQTLLAFFFYNLNSVDSPQFLIDLTDRSSKIVQAYEEHKRELLARIHAQEDKEADQDQTKNREKPRKYIFDLCDSDQIKEVWKDQDFVSVDVAH